MKLATLCYLRHHGKTLMLHRVKKEHDMHAGKWAGLGGKLEAGETPEECAIREVHEECGLRITNPTLKGLLTFPAADGHEEWRVFVYVAHEFEGNLTPSQEGNLEWVGDKEMPHLPAWEGDKVFLPWLDREGVFSAKFVYKDERLVDYSVVFHS